MRLAWWTFALLVIFLIVSPLASSQQSELKCEADGWCRIHVDTLKALVALSEMNCGPIQVKP